MTDKIPCGVYLVVGWKATPGGEREGQEGFEFLCEPSALEDTQRTQMKAFHELKNDPRNVYVAVTKVDGEGQKTRLAKYKVYDD